MPRNMIDTALAVAAAAAAVLCAGCAKHGAPEAAASAASVSIPVSVATAAVGSIAKSISVVGQLQSDTRVNLSSKIAARVVALNVTPGDRVKAGELVAQLDDSDIKAQLKQAQAAQAAAQASVIAARAAYVAASARLQQSLSGVGQKNAQTKTAIDAAQANLAGAKAHLEQAQSTYLIQDQQATTGVQQAQAALAAAKLRLRQAQTNSKIQDQESDSGVQQAQAILAAAQAHLQQMKTQVVIEEQDTDTGVQQAQANLKAAQENYSQISEGSREQEKSQAQLGVQRAQADYDHALASYNRMATLLKDGAISQQARDDSYYTMQTTKAALDTAKENLSLVLAGSRSQQVAVAAQQIRQAQAALSLANAQVARRAMSRDDVTSAEQDVNQAQAGLSLAQANVAKRSVSQDDVAAAEEQVKQSVAGLSLAQAQVAMRDVSQDDIQQAAQQVKQMQALLSQALAGTAQYAITAEDVRNMKAQENQAQAQIGQAQAQAQQAAAQVEYANEQLISTQIFSPISGVVDTVPATVGSSASPASTLMTIMPSRGVYFEADVPEASIASVHIGDLVATSIDALPGRTFQGRVSETIPIASATTRLYRVHISIPDAEGILPQNGFARGSIVVSRIQGIIVPKDCISTLVGDSYVYVVTDSHVHRRFVTLGIGSDTQVQIVAGLKTGEQYVTLGKDSVSDGAAVSIQPDARRPA